jgi:chitodextrinase
MRFIASFLFRATLGLVAAGGFAFEAAPALADPNPPAGWSHQTNGLTVSYTLSGNELLVEVANNTGSSRPYNLFMAPPSQVSTGQMVNATARARRVSGTLPRFGVGFHLFNSSQSYLTENDQNFLGNLTTSYKDFSRNYTVASGVGYVQPRISIYHIPNGSSFSFSLQLYSATPPSGWSQQGNLTVRYIDSGDELLVRVTNTSGSAQPLNLFMEPASQVSTGQQVNTSATARLVTGTVPRFGLGFHLYNSSQGYVTESDQDFASSLTGSFSTFNHGYTVASGIGYVQPRISIYQIANGASFTFSLQRGSPTPPQGWSHQADGLTVTYTENGTDLTVRITNNSGQARLYNLYMGGLTAVTTGQQVTASARARLVSGAPPRFGVGFHLFNSGQSYVTESDQDFLSSLTATYNTFEHDYVVAGGISYVQPRIGIYSIANEASFSFALDRSTPNPGDTTAPTVPSGLSASGVSSTQIDLSWNASTDNVGVTGYRIYRNGALVATVSQLNYSDTGLSPSTTYSYEVSARDAAGNESARSAAVNGTTQANPVDNTPPSVPTGLAATAASSTQISLTWNASTDNVGVTGYRVYRNSTLVATVSQLSYSDTGLSPSTTYNYRVSARDAAGNESAQSTQASATTPAAPDPGCSLTNSGPVNVTQNGQIVQNLFITASGQPAIRVNGFSDVIIRNVRINHTGAEGIVFTNAPRLRIENVSVLHTGAPSSGPNTSTERNNISGTFSADVVMRNVRLEKGSSGVYLIECPRANLSLIEGHDFRGPFPRGQLVQFDKSHNSLLEDFSCENPVGSWPEDNISSYRSDNVTIRRGLIDGNNSPSGIGVMFEQDQGQGNGGLAEDVDAIRQGNGCFSGYPARNVTFNRTRCIANICTDQGRGPPLSNALAWAGEPSSTNLKVLNSTHSQLCNPGNVIWDENVFTTIELSSASNVTPRAPQRLNFCWQP